MTNSPQHTEKRLINRKRFVAELGLILGGLVAGCTPAKILFKAYPDKFGNDPALVERYLRAFVLTVIPGAPADDPNLTRIFRDDYYPFHSHCAFFVSDLADRGAEMFGEEDFSRLSPDERTRVIQSGLDGDAITSRLYRGAVYMSQVSFFGSIYDDERGCELIGYPGTEQYHSPEEMFYPDPSRYLSFEITGTGNYR
jgi:hypothetical protein